MRSEPANPLTSGQLATFRQHTKLAHLAARRAVAKVGGGARCNRGDGTPLETGRQSRGLGSLTAKAGEYTLRRLRVSDGASWSASRRANGDRMGPWWGENDWWAATSESAFLSHYLSWRVMAARGSGAALAIAGVDGVTGEALIQVRHGGKVAELGLWQRPGESGRAMVGLLGALLEQLFFVEGVERVDAPVAVGNDHPRKLLEFAGFPHEGRMRSWRPMGSVMVDMDLYGQTATGWRDGPGRVNWRRVSPRRDHAPGEALGGAALGLNG